MPREVNLSKVSQLIGGEPQPHPGLLQGPCSDRPHLAASSPAAEAPEEISGNFSIFIPHGLRSSEPHQTSGRC